MSPENVEVVRLVLDAFNRGDYAAALEALDEAVEWHPPPRIRLEEDVYNGRDEVAEAFANWLGAWETYSFEETEIRDCGHDVFVSGFQTGRGRSSGVDVREPSFHVYTVRQGRIVRMRSYDERAEALEAAGLRE